MPLFTLFIFYAMPPTRFATYAIRTTMPSREFIYMRYAARRCAMRDGDIRQCLRARYAIMLPRARARAMPEAAHIAVRCCAIRDSGVRLAARDSMRQYAWQRRGAGSAVSH